MSRSGISYTPEEIAALAWNADGLVNGFWHGKAGIAQEPIEFI